MLVMSENPLLRYTGRMIVVDGLSVELCLDFSNRLVHLAVERRLGDDHVLGWLTKAGLTDEGATYARDPQKAVDRATRLCLAINRAFSASATGSPIQEASLKLIERETTDALGSLEIASTGAGFVWAFRHDRKDPDLALGLVALSASMLLTGPLLARVRLCANETCGWLFLDQSKNRSRKWCDMADCGNKVKARRHYAKVRAAKERPDQR